MATSRVLRVLIELLIVDILLVWDDLLQTLLHSEPLHSIDSVQDDLLLTNLPDLASIDHVAHQLGCPRVVASSLLSVFDFASQGGQLSHICFHLHSPVFHHVLLFLDLVLGLSSFAAHLEYAIPHALGHYL